MAALPPARDLREQLGRTLRLAAPVVVARAGFLIMAAVDTAMTGHAGALQLAYLGLGIAPSIPIMMIGIGTLQGTAVLSAQAFGAGRPGQCGLIWRSGLKLAAVLGIFFGLLCLLGEPFLRGIGQAPDLARGGGVVMAMMSWNIAAIMVFSATTLFLESINRPLPGMLAMIAANVLNAGLNWMFIYGHGGAPEMGAEGAVLATGIARWFIVVALVAYALLMPDAVAFGARGVRPSGDGWVRRMLRFGVPIAVAQGVESSAFMTLVMMAGYLGAAALGGYQIAFNLVALVFMGAIGLATATSVWVGHAVGRGDARGIALAGWAGALLVAILMGGFALVFGLMPDSLAAFYTTDAAVLAMARAAIVVAALFLVFDGAQAVLMGALRGAGDVWMPMGMQMFSFWALSVPVAGLLTFDLGFGVGGLMGGVLAGVLSAALSLGWRFHVIARRAAARL